jgi:predicted molibdopterin-dependent oxidoreductase YjgC
VVTDAVRPGSVFVPFVKLQESAANFLTNNAYDEASRIPEYKVCAVRVEKKRPRPTGPTGAPPTASHGR